jgi:tetratricopeptide (TPR) repeat protein
LVAGKTIAEGATVLEQFENTKISAVLTEKLGDLYAAQGKPASAAHAYQQALLLDPTPQQKIRLQLALGEKLTASDQPVPAYDTYQTLLRQNPDFPDKNAIYKLLLPLAQKLGKTAEISSYRAALDEQGAKK